MFDQFIKFKINITVLIIVSFVLLGFAGPRYNDEGAPIPHSLLGSYDEFRKEAIKRGDLLVRNNLPYLWEVISLVNLILGEISFENGFKNLY